MQIRKRERRDERPGRVLAAMQPQDDATYRVPHRPEGCAHHRACDRPRGRNFTAALDLPTSLMEWLVPLLCMSLVVLLVVLLIRMDTDLNTARLSVPKGAFRGMRVAIIGASEGIGRSLALRLAREGAELVLCARRMPMLEEVVRECHKMRAHAEAHRVDVLDLKSHESLREELEAKLGGPIDVLVNNAGRSQRSLAEETDLEVTRQLLELNVIGNISVTKAFLTSMLERGKGHIVVTSSFAGLIPTPLGSSYSLTKFALQGYYGALRNEVAARGVDVTLVCPGPVESALAGKAFTGKAGVSLADLGDKSHSAAGRVTGERCAELMARAIAHPGQDEVWIGNQPFLFFAAISTYLPGLAYWLGKRVFGPRRVKAWRETGTADYTAVTSLFAPSAPATTAPKIE